jgi:hypothetical protein
VHFYETVFLLTLIQKIAKSVRWLGHQFILVDRRLIDSSRCIVFKVLIDYPPSFAIEMNLTWVSTLIMLHWHMLQFFSQMHEGNDCVCWINLCVNLWARMISLSNRISHITFVYSALSEL